MAWVGMNMDMDMGKARTVTHERRDGCITTRHDSRHRGERRCLDKIRRRRDRQDENKTRRHVRVDRQSSRHHPTRQGGNTRMDPEQKKPMIAR